MPYSVDLNVAEQLAIFREAIFHHVPFMHKDRVNGDHKNAFNFHQKGKAKIEY